jgi:uncharacterized membrane protein
MTTLIVIATGFVLIFAAWLRDELEVTRTARGALRRALDRGEIGDEAYARGLQALDQLA